MTIGIDQLMAQEGERMSRELAEEHPSVMDGSVNAPIGAPPAYERFLREGVAYPESPPEQAQQGTMTVSGAGQQPTGGEEYTSNWGKAAELEDPTPPSLRVSTVAGSRTTQVGKDDTVQAQTQSAPLADENDDVLDWMADHSDGIFPTDQLPDDLARPPEERESVDVSGVFSLLDSLQQRRAPLAEKWDKDDVVDPAKKGMFKGWTVAELKTLRSKLMAKAKRTPAEQTKVRQINFALRSKKGWGKVETGAPPAEGADTAALVRTAIKRISEGSCPKKMADLLLRW